MGKKNTRLKPCNSRESVCGKNGKAIQGSINESNNVKNDDITKNKLLATLGLYKKNPLN